MRKRAVTAAIVFHVAVTVTVFLISRLLQVSQIFPDSTLYQTQITIAAELLRQKGLAAWFLSLWPFHVKLHSLLFAVLGGTNFSMLWSEPLNALFYLAILALVFHLSRQIFTARTALLTAIAIGIWPTFLLHTTQPLKDPIFILLALLFLTINSIWLTSEPSAKKALVITGLGTISAFCLWLVKSQMWQVMIAAQFITCALVVIKMIRARKLYVVSLAGALILLAATVAIPKVILLYKPVSAWEQEQPGADLDRNQKASSQQIATTPYEPPRSIFAARIGALRHHFIERYPRAGSNIDNSVDFHSVGDVIKYLPRATAIGLFAPFPHMWFEPATTVGRAGRLLTGAEMLVMYFFEAFALITVWKRREEILVWWLMLIFLLGCTALGLVVTNVGALYRMRYLFVILLVIPAIDGLRFSVEELVSRRRKAVVSASSRSDG